MARKARSATDRYWEKVAWTEDPSDCWLWTAARDRDGYGVFTPNTKEMIQWRAHRYAYYLMGWDMPVGSVVCHRCDNRACVNPMHLVLGSASDNNHERDERGRTSRGARHYKAKLDRARAAEIRARYRPGRPRHPGNGEDLMAEFGIGKSTLYRVLRRELWA